MYTTNVQHLLRARHYLKFVACIESLNPHTNAEVKYYYYPHF